MLSPNLSGLFFFILFIFFLNTDFHLYNPPAISLIFLKQKRPPCRVHMIFSRADTTVFFCYIKIFNRERYLFCSRLCFPHIALSSGLLLWEHSSKVFWIVQIGNSAKLQIEKRFMRLRAVPNVLHPCAVQVLFLQVREAAECVSF